MLKDWRDNELMIGSRIVWSTGGSYAYMKEGIIEGFNTKPARDGSGPVVTSIKVRCTDVSGYHKSEIGGLVTIQRFDRVTVIY